MIDNTILEVKNLSVILRRCFGGLFTAQFHLSVHIGK